MVSLTVTHADASTDTIDETLGWERQRTIGEMRRVRIRVDRADAKAANLEPKTDKIAIGSIDTVRLWDIETGGASWTLVCYSFENDARRVAPIAGGTLYEGDDQTLITDLINDVPTWTVGSIANLTGALSFVFNHSNRSMALRRIEKNVPGELQWSNEGTVDYVDDLGSDKTATVTISPSQGNLEGLITITERGRILDGTHVRVIGALEGEAQPFANLVPSTDPASYDNHVNYTTSRWSAGDDKDWDVWDANSQDVTDQATLEEEAAALGAELSESLVEAKATIVEGTANLGDWIRVENPDADLNRDMRVHKITTKAGSFNNTDSGAAVVDEVLLSTRTVMRQQGDEDLQDLNRFRSGYQGTSIWGTLSGGFQPVSTIATTPYTLPIYYPDIVYENRVELQIQTFPYRAFSSGATNQTDQITGISDVATLGSDTVLSPGQVATISTTIDANYLGDILIVECEVNSDGDEHPLDVHLETNTAQDGSEFGTFTDGIGNVSFTDTFSEVSAGDTIDFDIQNPSRASTDITIQDTSGFVSYEPLHQHGPDPGIIEFSGETSDSVSVFVNGQLVDPPGTIGSGNFTATVDLAGELTTDQWNTIEINSNNICQMLATLSVEAYRKIGAN